MLNELGYTYMNYYGKCNITKCTHCGKLIKIKSKTKIPMYCENCARDIHNEINKNCMRDKRKA